ncbi:BTAD domain-containing putative transcriptional regulator [Bacillus coreaensis]
MKRFAPVIQTKLIPPAVKEGLIRRAKLTNKMKAIPKIPLTIIHSGAGYGKSTALAQYISESPLTACWYTTSSADDDIFPFLQYVIAAIQTIHPSFGKELSKHIELMGRYVREEELHVLTSLFVNEVLEMKEEFIVIIDDYHQVEHSYNVNRWCELLLDHIPGNLHLIVSSRTRPLWKSLMKMKVSQLMLEINKTDLVLTREEMEWLLIDSYGLELDEERLNQIVRITEGWVIAIGILATHVKEEGAYSEDLLSIQELPLEELFQYLVQEVFAKQSVLIQQFLEQTSVFEEMDEELCNTILGIRGTKTMLDTLVEKNLFIQKMGLEKYRYHALFKEFLEEQLKQNNQLAYVAIHEKCARYYESRKEWEYALIHYEKMNHYDAVASLLNDFGPHMLEDGKLEGLYDRIKRLPAEHKDPFPRLWFLQGEVLRYRSGYMEAEACYEKAYTLASRKGDDFEISKALEGKAKILLDTIQPHHAERLLYEAIDYREKSNCNNSSEVGSLYTLLAENLINSGQAQKAEKWIKRAKSLSMDYVDRHVEARLFLRTGRLKEAKRLLEEMKMSEEGQKSHLPQSHRETVLLLSLVHAFMGMGEEAKKLAQDGIQQGITSQSAFSEACGWIRMGHAVQQLEKYDLSLAKRCYETALTIMEEIRVDRGKAEPLMGLCLLYGTEGELERALEAGHAALRETERVKDVWLSSLITLTMGIALVYNEKYDESERLFVQAEELSKKCNDDYVRMYAYFWQSYVLYQKGRMEDFEEKMTQFIHEAQIGNYEFVFQKKTIFGPRDLHMCSPLLIKAMKLGISNSYIGKLLQDMGLVDLDSHPGYSLRIQTLGQFKVFIGTNEVEDRAWQRGKARELLQLFVTQKNHLFQKEEIYQSLWPDHDEKHAVRDFKVALNALNNALEPHRKARGNPYFIVREGSSYGLNPIAGIDVDAVEFEKWVQLGLEERELEKALGFLQKGLNLYHGHYLPERRFIDWCINERERLHVYFLRGAEKIAQLHVRIEEYDHAIHWCERILDTDRTWEEAYRLLMYCYYRKNNRPFAMKWYQKCCAILDEELGVSPLEPTKHMYEMIVSTNE